MPDNEVPVADVRATALALMRKPFADNQISKMCRPTKKDNPPGRCNACSGWHKLPAIQLSYVGHAALTDRLLDADPSWTWEPLSYAPDGSPFLDANGGLWIKLTVAGVTRLGYGDAQGKVGGDAMKERIGDALRNAGMRFGAALDLWHKGDLHADEEPSPKFEKQTDGSFKKSPETVQTTNAVPNPPVVTQGKLPETPKPVTRKKEKVVDAGKPWGGTFDKKPAETAGQLIAVEEEATRKPGPNAITPENPITDADVLFPGDPEPEPARLATERERKLFMDRLIVLKNKGFTGIRDYLLKESGETITNNIPFLKMTELVARLEQQEKNGDLKALLG